ncbi:MAG: type VI secretion system contractile sheath large subunit, partial [Planctomycetaceae bacterium]|nr:type VI secretion system contractile sheath large subunit [Planctomycetaceae bacterium]
VVRVLNCTKSELFKDLDRAIEFDQSSIFRKIYEAEFGTPGGEPFGILLGDYAMSNRLDDVQLMSGMTEIAAAAFAPFVTSPSPQLFELETFRDLPLISDLSTTFDARRNPAYIKWNALRQKEDSRFLGLVLPRMLMRRPHADDGSRVDQFIYQETLDGGIGGYLWGNAAYAFGEVVIRSYQNSGWLAGIRGMTPGTRSGGLVTQLPTHWFETDAPLIAPRCATEAIITEQQEKALSEAGFIPLCDCQDSPYAVFYSNQSVQLPKTYQEADATQNARLSAMLQYMLCVSRFAHCIKVMIRDRVGSFEDAPDIEKFLHNWIINYVTPDDDAGLETKARFPLREAQVSVRPHPENPGKYHCTVHLRPHFELDDLTASVELRTELGGRST